MAQVDFLRQIDTDRLFDQGGDSTSFSLNFEDDLLQELNTLPGLNEYSDITLDLLEDPVMMVQPNLKEEDIKMEDTFLNIFSPETKEQTVTPTVPPPPLKPRNNKVIQLHAVSNKKVFRLDSDTHRAIKLSPVTNIRSLKLNTTKLNTKLTTANLNTKLNTTKVNTIKLDASKPRVASVKAEPLIQESCTPRLFKREPSQSEPSQSELTQSELSRSPQSAFSDSEGESSDSSLDLNMTRKRCTDTESSGVKRARPSNNQSQHSPPGHMTSNNQSQTSPSARSDVLNLCKRTDSNNTQHKRTDPIIVTIKREEDEYIKQHCSDIAYQNMSLKGPERHRRGSRTTVQVPPHLKTDAEIKGWKREQRMLKNRESACLSRRRKKEYLASVESQLAMTSDQNTQLLRDNQALRKHNKTLQHENGLLRNALDRLNSLVGTKTEHTKNTSTKGGTKGTVLMVLFLVIFGMSVGPLSLFSKMSTVPRYSETRAGYGRSLLSVHTSDRREGYTAEREGVGYTADRDGLGYREYMMPPDNIESFTNYLKGRSDADVKFRAEPDKQYIVSSESVYIPYRHTHHTQDTSRVSVILPRHDKDGPLVEMVCDVVESNNITRT